MKRSVGRPTVVTPEAIEKAWEYVDGAWATEELPVVGKSVYPMVEGLSRYVNIATSTIYVRPEFSDIIKEIKELQHVIVVQGGLSGKFNPLTSKLILSSKHGYVEKSSVEQDHKSSDGTMSPKESVSKSTLDEVVQSLKQKTAEDAE